MSASRRKSLNVLAALASEAELPSPSLFNLRDLALMGLQSTNRQTVLATLRLLNVVLQRHHPFARALIHTVSSQPAQQRSVGAFNAELEQLLGLGTSLIDEPTLNESYDNYVSDATWVLESRLCLPVSVEEAEDDIPLPQQLQQDDPIVQGLLSCVDSFFTNSVIVNLALTGVLMSLASSHLFSLDGWVLVDPAQYDPPSEVPSDALDHIRQAYRAPTWPATAAPTLTSALRRLVDQVRQWQQDLPDFDVLIAARRELLHKEHDPVPDSSEPAETDPTSTDRSRLSYPGSPEPSQNSRDRSPGMSSGMRDDSSVRPIDSRGSDSTAEALRQRLAMPFPPDPVQPEEVDPTLDADHEQSSVTLGHVLTNIVILYEFLLELSAVVQARGSLFEEAGYS